MVWEIKLSSLCCIFLQKFFYHASLIFGSQFYILNSFCILRHSANAHAKGTVTEGTYVRASRIRPLAIGPETQIRQVRIQKQHNSVQNPLTFAWWGIPGGASYWRGSVYDEGTLRRRPSWNDRPHRRCRNRRDEVVRDVSSTASSSTPLYRSCPLPLRYASSILRRPPTWCSDRNRQPAAIVARILGHQNIVSCYSFIKWLLSLLRRKDSIAKYQSDLGHDYIIDPVYVGKILSTTFYAPISPISPNKQFAIDATKSYSSKRRVRTLPPLKPKDQGNQPARCDSRRPLLPPAVVGASQTRP